MSQRIYLPRYPMGAAPSPLQPSFKQGGFTRPGGGSGAYNPPPTGWIVPNNANFRDGADPGPDWEVTGDSSTTQMPNSSDTVPCDQHDGHDPNTLPELGAARLSRSSSSWTIWQGVTYLGWKNAGYSFDRTNGFRIMACLGAGADTSLMLYAWDSSGGYVRESPPNWPDGSFIRSSFWDEGGTYGANDRMYYYTKIKEGAQVEHTPYTQLATKARGPAYVYLGIEYPAGGVGNITFRSTHAYKAGQTWPVIRTIACPDFEDTLFDSVATRMNLKNTGQYTHLLGCWYGTLSDDWPV